MSTLKKFLFIAALALSLAGGSDMMAKSLGVSLMPDVAACGNGNGGDC